nr:MAG TPA: activating signal cointegrator [Caudoviricetes sp.]
MTSILISINPKWCELIASGKKTIEVRKTRPKIEIPFKCYIYCTQSGKYKNGKIARSHPVCPGGISFLFNL